MAAVELSSGVSLPAILRPIDLSKIPDDDLFRIAGQHLRLERYATDPLAFGRETFPHHFRLSTSARWHQQAIGLMTRTAQRVEELPIPREISTSREPSSLPVSKISANSHNSVMQTLSKTSPLRLAFHAPRGHAKSTLASFLVPLWYMLQGNKHFILLVSNTHSQAVKFLQAIKTEWETNGKLRGLCPEVRPNKEKWADSDIELRREGHLAHKLIALGSGHQLRGLRFLQWRPDLVIIDDGEDDEMVRSDLRRLAYQEWLDNVVLKVDPQCDILMVGTIIHELAMLNRLIRQKDEADAQRYADWDRHLFPVLDGAGQSTWPERESTEQLLAERERNPYSFSQEKQGEPVDPSYCPFKAEFFTERRFWANLPSHLSISITIDPAWTIRDYSKETALVCAGWDGQRRLWVLDTHHAKYDDPSVIMDIILDWYARWNKNEEVNREQRFFCVGFDAISAQKAALVTPFKKLCEAKGLHPVIRELKADRDKVRRIWPLEELFRHDRIFLRPDMTYLQAQLQGFPRNVQGGLVDVADALAYHLQLESYRPSVVEEPADMDPTLPQPLTVKEYLGLHDSTAAYRKAYPEWEGRLDARLLAEVVKGWAN